MSVFPCLSPVLNVVWAPRYLQNGNILAARTFIIHLVSQMTSRRRSFISSLQPSPIPVGKPGEGDQDEIIFTTEPTVNFAQLAVRACQRAQGDRNKTMREAWVRLCGTYQSKGGLIAHREVRKVRCASSWSLSGSGNPCREAEHAASEWINPGAFNVAVCCDLCDP